MTFHAVHRIDTGELVSIATILPNPLPEGLASVSLGARKPDWSVRQWDPAALRMVAKPPPPPPRDRVEGLEVRVPALAKLTAPELEAVKVEVGRLLGDRYE
jgi:hypothetical protein